MGLWQTILTRLCEAGPQAGDHVLQGMGGTSFGGRRCMSDPDLEKIRELGEKVSKHFRDMVRASPVPPRTEYPAQTGRILCTNIYHEQDLAAMICDMEADTWMVKHDHDVHEVLIPMRGGSVEVYFEGGECQVAGPGEAITIPAGKPHWVHWPNETRQLTVSIPASPYFAGGSEAPHAG
jgi:quercetin dioxygenase-like cupin family protein